MKMFEKIKRTFSRRENDDDDLMPENNTEYVELDTESGSIDSRNAKVIVRPYSIEDFSDVKEILDEVREGRTIALVNIKVLKDKDMIELKRAINKIKKTIDAIDGDIAGFGDDYLVVTPSFAKIHRSPRATRQEERHESDLEEY